MPPYRPTPGWLRAAAVIALLLAGALLVPPVRAWISGVLAPVFGVRDDAAPAVGSESATEAPIDTLAITVNPGGPTFSIGFAATPAGGTLTVERTDAAQGSASLYTRGGGEGFLLLPDGIRITNTPGSTADYRIVLPGIVGEVMVRVPGREEVVWRTAGDAPQRRVLELGAGQR